LVFIIECSNRSNIICQDSLKGRTIISWIKNENSNFSPGLGGYSSIGRTAVCGIVYPCSIQGIHLFIKKK
jgi:hypothetical protein